MTDDTKGRFDCGTVVLSPMYIRRFRSLVKTQGPWPLLSFRKSRVHREIPSVFHSICYVSRLPPDILTGSIRGTVYSHPQFRDIMDKVWRQECLTQVGQEFIHALVD